MHIWDSEYKTPSDASLKDYTDQTVGIVVREVNTNDDGATTSVLIDVVPEDADQDVTPVRVGVKRILGQLSKLPEGEDRTIATVARYGKRGVVLAPPPSKPSKAFVDRVTAV